jgi:succinoglycan biosynthesis protein ExoM
VTRRVAICVLTLHRPVGLAALLTALGRLDPLPPDVGVRVVVVDNDPEGSARSTVAEAGRAVPWPIEYVVEPLRGIPFARNRAVATAGDVDFVVFVDDDEVPDPGWLRELLAVQETTGADVVEGPALPAYPAGAPAWVVRGRFFERPRHVTGTAVNYATTSNVLIAARVFPPGGHPFHEGFGLNGGDDTHFFERARLAGHRMVWADGAVVRETVPPSRMTVGWLLRREFRRGNTLSLCLRDLDDSPRRRARRLVHAGLRLVQGSVLVVVGLARGRVMRVRGLRWVAFGAGLVSGLFGWKYAEYRVVHGS